MIIGWKQYVSKAICNNLYLNRLTCCYSNFIGVRIALDTPGCFIGATRETRCNLMLANYISFIYGVFITVMALGAQ